MNRPTLRRALPEDAARIADIHLASFRATYRFPLVHPDSDVRRWISDEVVGGMETWIADLRPHAVVGYLALDGSEVRSLYVMPGYTGAGVGAILLEHAKACRPRGLELWTFQVNAGARRFYERHGFRVVGMTDGRDNEERQPDVRYSWTPRSSGGC